MPAPTCLRCQGRMSTGFLIDNTYGARGIATWLPGPPRRSLWTGVKIDKKAVREVETWRCDRCGYLESYAP